MKKFADNVERHGCRGQAAARSVNGVENLRIPDKMGKI